MAKATIDDLPDAETLALERMLDGLCLDSRAELIRITDPMASVSEAYASYSEHIGGLGEQ